MLSGDSFCLTSPLSSFAQFQSFSMPDVSPTPASCWSGQLNTFLASYVFKALMRIAAWVLGLFVTQEKTWMKGNYFR